MIGYHFIRLGDPLPPVEGLFDYLVGANGVFVHGAREGLEVVLPLTATVLEAVRGLADITPLVQCQRVSEKGVEALLAEAFAALPNEILFFLQPGEGGSWEVTIPEQVAMPGSVRPLDESDPAGAAALIEVHSHGRLRAFFSAQDDEEESFGFRIYAVLGRVDTALPQIAARVGLHGMFFNIPAAWVFDLPAGWGDRGCIAVKTEAINE